MAQRQNGSKLNRSKLEKFKLPEEYRGKIANSNILNRLIRVAEGKETMDSVQASVAVALMRKVLPDLASQEMTINQAQPFAVLPQVAETDASWEATHSPDVAPTRPEGDSPVVDSTKH